MALTPELIRIHAHLCGDGSIQQYKTSEKDRKLRAEIIYYNSNPKLIEEFRKDMKKEFGVKMTYNRKRQKVVVKSLRIADELLSYSEYKSYKWRVPQVIINSPRKLKVEWVKAFAKDDGYTPKSRNIIRIKSVNYQGLKDIKRMIDQMKIRNWITGPNRDNTWYLNIAKEKDFLNFVKEACRK